MLPCVTQLMRMPPRPRRLQGKPAESTLLKVEHRLLTLHFKRSSQVLRRFRQRRPKWVNPLAFLDPDLQNLFDLSYFSESGALVPTGWNSTTEDGPLPRLSSREPKLPASDIEMRSPEPLDGTDESGSEGSARLPTSVVTRMAEESSDEDSDFPKAKVRNISPLKRPRLQFD